MRSSAAQIIEDINRVRADQTVRRAALGHVPTLEQQREMTLLAKQHAQLFHDLELNLPQPGAQDRPSDYKIELLKRLRHFSPTFGDTDLRSLAVAGGLSGAVEQSIVDSAQRIASNRTIGSFRRPGHLRELHRTDEAGHATVEFAGEPISWMQAFMSPVVTMVEAWNTKRR